MVCNALLEKARRRGLRLGRRSILQGEIWVRAASGTVVHEVAISGDFKNARRSEKDVCAQTKAAGLAAGFEASILVAAIEG